MGRGGKRWVEVGEHRRRLEKELEDGLRWVEVKLDGWRWVKVKGGGWR